MKKLFFFCFLFSFSITLYSADFAGGTGTADDPFLISTPEHLDSMRKYIPWFDATAYYYFRLINDIDLNVPPYNEGKGWRPIGYRDWPEGVHYKEWEFPGCIIGNINGGGHSIKNLYINRPDDENVGLICLLVDAIVDSLNFVDCNITGLRWVGALAGKLVNFNNSPSVVRRISDCSVSGIVKGQLNMGGLIGETDSDYRYHNSFINCSSSANVTYSINDTNFGGYFIGGLIGWNNLDTLIGCCAIGNVMGGSHDTYGLCLGGRYIFQCYAIGDVIGNDIVRGLCGLDKLYLTTPNTYQCFSTGNVQGNNFVSGSPGTTNCYSTGNVIGKAFVGGILSGHNTMVITNCYSIGKIFCEENFSGGIAGSPYESIYDAGDITTAKIENCVSINSEITGSFPRVNRIIGRSSSRYGYKGNVKLSNNYALDTMKVNGNIITSSKAFLDEGKDATMAELTAQNFYENVLGWDFESVWKICPNSGYPFPVFQWQDCDSLKVNIIEIKGERINISVYPNPANDKVNIEFDIPSNSGFQHLVEISLCNVLGQKILNMFEGTTDTEHFQQTFPLQNISIGSYFIKFTIDNKTKYEKINIVK
jgi:hypothetical protein